AVWKIKRMSESILNICNTNLPLSTQCKVTRERMHTTNITSIRLKLVPYNLLSSQHHILKGAENFLKNGLIVLKMLTKFK
ncbi:hypothetical protein VIGAN_05228100, partial [Vigna angularis var. angularis]